MLRRGAGGRGVGRRWRKFWGWAEDIEKRAKLMLDELAKFDMELRDSL